MQHLSTPRPVLPRKTCHSGCTVFNLVFRPQGQRRRATLIVKSAPCIPEPKHQNPINRPTFHTGSSAFRLPKPLLSTSTPMYGPTTGAFLANPAIVPRKSPKSTMMPYNSTRKPIRGHRKRMRSRPPKNAAVPFAFCFRAKKRSVFCGPMMMVRPMRKRICESGLELGVRVRGDSGDGWRS